MSRPSLVVGAAVVVSLPMLVRFAEARITATAAAERFLVALLACWLFAAVLTWVLTTYGEQARRAETIRAIEEARDAGSRPEGDPLGP